MQRQSLGSPASKLPIKVEENATSPLNSDEDDDKSLKPTKQSRKPERYLHVIPLLTALCFLLLYLSSHDPSQTELAEFSGFNWPLNNIEDTNKGDTMDVKRYIEIERNDLSGFRSLKNVKHERETHGFEYRPHRKIANFYCC